MADRGQKMREHLELRNAAKRLLRADLGMVKRDVKDKPVASRLASGAGDFAVRNKATLGTGLLVAAGAFAAWMFRDRIGDALAAFADGDEQDEYDDYADEEPEPDARARRSDKDTDSDED